jgi:hypothetical protein
MLGAILFVPQFYPSNIDYLDFYLAIDLLEFLKLSFFGSW